MKQIKLSNSNSKVLVDDEDYSRVSKFTWRKHNDGRTDYFTIRATMKGKEVYLHRYILNLKTNKVVDHKDGNTLNNQKKNLSVVAQSKNVAYSNTKRKKKKTPKK